MKITIIYDNTSHNHSLEADWGFAAFLEHKNHRILFDTGQSGKILLNNLKKLDISPKEIDDVFISHSHFDHTGGLSAILEINNDLRVILPPSFRGVKNAREVIEAKEPMEIAPNIYTTGELEGKEQFLCYKSSKGIAIIAGCSHPSMETILQAASKFGKPYAIIGGLHGTNPELIEGLDLIVATHCTKYIDTIKSLYPDAYKGGGAGKLFEI